MKKISKVLLLSSAMLLLAGCGGNSKPVDPVPPGPTPVEPDNPDTTKKDFEGIKFEDSTVVYDGKPHKIEVIGAPEGTIINYKEIGPCIDAGTYKFEVTLTKEGYNDLTKTATLKVTKADYNLTLESKTLTYDRLEHIKDIKLNKEVPEGTEVKKTIKLNGESVTSAINVGTYKYEFALKNKNYNDVTLKADLVISKATFDRESYKYESVSVGYDGADHINDVQFVGVLPETSTITQVVTKDDVEVTQAIDSGTYNYTCTITDPNYEDIIFEAQLKITSKEEELGVVAVGDKIYFANQIHDKYLYAYDTVAGTYEMVSRDVVESFASNSDGSEHVFISKAGFLSSVKTLDNTGEIKGIYSENVSEIIYGIGNSFIFAKNGLTDEKSGIYELTFDAEHNPITKLLYTGKAARLTLAGTGLYFTHKNELHYINLGNGTLKAILEDEKPVKVTEIVSYGDQIVVNRNKLLGDYIELIGYDGSNFVQKKVTKDAGKYLNIVGDEVYFSNIDKLNGTLFGAGIYKANLKNIVPDFTSTKVIPSENLISNLYISGTDAYYYHVENKSLYHADLSAEQIVSENLLEGFVKPEPTTLTTVPGKNVEYKGKIYYTNVYDDKSLYRYDPSNGKTVKITSNTIKDFIIVDDVLYYNEITWIVNHDLYALDLVENSAPRKLSSDDCVELVKHGNYLYYTKLAAKAKLSFERIVLNEENKVEVVSETPYSNVRVLNNKLYAIKNNKLGDTMVELDFANEADVTKFGAEHVFNPNIKSFKYYEFFKTKNIDCMLLVKANKLYFTTLTQKSVAEIKIADKVETVHIDPTTNDQYFVTTKGEICKFIDASSSLDYTYLYRPQIVGEGLLKAPEIMPTQLTFVGDYIYFNSDQDNSYHFYRLAKNSEAETAVLEQLD